MTNRLGLLAAIVVLAAGLSACGDDDGSDAEGATPPAESTAATFPLTVQNCGEDVTFEQRPESVLTTWPSALALMVGAGAADRVTHRAGEYGQPLRDSMQAVSDVPVLQADEYVSREVVLGAGVDMVIGYTLGDNTRAALAKAGIASFIMSLYCGPQSSGVGTYTPGIPGIERSYRDLELLGRIFGTEDAAAATIERTKARIAAVQDTFDPGGFKTAVVLPVFGDSFYVNTRQSVAHEMLGILGLENVITEDPDDDGIELSIEKFIALDPDIVIVGQQFAEDDVRSPADTIAKLRSLPGVADMKAVKAGHVVTFLYEVIEPSPLVADGLEDIAEQISAFK